MSPEKGVLRRFSHAVATKLCVVGWFFLNIVIQSLMKWVYINAELCKEG